MAHLHQHESWLNPTFSDILVPQHEQCNTKGLEATYMPPIHRQPKLSGIKWLQALSNAWPPHTSYHKRTNRPIQCSPHPRTLRDIGLLLISYCAVAQQQALQALHLANRRTPGDHQHNQKLITERSRRTATSAVVLSTHRPNPMRKPCDSNSRCAAFKTSNGTKQLDLQPAACGC